MPYKAAFAPHFGIFHLNLHEAGILIAKCLWFRGELNIKDAESSAYDFNDVELENKLKHAAMHYSVILKQAIADGRLEPSRLSCEIEGLIIPDQTYVDALVMADWLEDSGLRLGEAFDDEYISEEENLAQKIALSVAAERHRGNSSSKEGISTNAENIFLRQRIAELEQQLENQNRQTPAHAPISEKQRGAFLNIVGALLGLLLAKSPSGKPYSVFESQQAIIDAIHANFGEAAGLSQRNLADKFAEGKRTLSSTAKL